MPETPDTASLQRDVDSMRKRFDELMAAQTTGRIQVFVLLIVIVGMFAVFAYQTKAVVYGNFQDEAAVQAAMTKHGQEVLPAVQESITGAMKNILPEYRRLATERFEAIKADFGAKALVRLEKVPEENGKIMATALATSFDKVLDRLEPEIQKTFPSLTDAQKRDLLTVHFHEAIDARNKEIAARVEQIYTNELSSMKAALDRFELPPEEAMPTQDQATREFLRTLTTLVDYQLLKEGNGTPSTASVK